MHVLIGHEGSWIIKEFLNGNYTLVPVGLH